MWVLELADFMTAVDNKTEENNFWDFIDRLVTGSRVVIDRPCGSTHPRYPDLIYPLDYGFLDGTRTVDGGGVDVFVGSLMERTLDALVLTVDLVKREVEIKLILGCTPVEKRVVLDFLIGTGMCAYLVSRIVDPKAIIDPKGQWL